jgi:hypothetical protein
MGSENRFVIPDPLTSASIARARKLAKYAIVERTTLTSPVLKSITAGQNLQTTEKYLEAVPHRPYVIERPSPGESFSSMRPSEGSIAEKEYTSIDEKREGFPLEPKERVEPEQAGCRGLYNSTK